MSGQILDVTQGYMTGAKHTQHRPHSHTLSVAWVRNFPTANKSTPFSLYSLETSFSSAEQLFFPVSCGSEEATALSVCIRMTIERADVWEGLLKVKRSGNF